MFFSDLTWNTGISHDSTTTEQIRLTLDHQLLYLNRNFSVIAWKVSGLDHTEFYFELNLTDRCSLTSDVHTETVTVVNKTRSTQLSFQPASLLGEGNVTSYDLKLTMYNTQQNQTTSMEVFRLHPQSKYHT